MLRFFKNVHQRVESEHVFEMALKLSKDGKKQEALLVCQELVSKYPYDVQFRHKLALLQKETGVPLDLPKIHVKQSPGSFG